MLDKNKPVKNSYSMLKRILAKPFCTLFKAALSFHFIYKHLLTIDI